MSLSLRQSRRPAIHLWIGDTFKSISTFYLLRCGLDRRDKDLVTLLQGRVFPVDSLFRLTPQVLHFAIIPATSGFGLRKPCEERDNSLIFSLLTGGRRIRS